MSKQLIADYYAAFNRADVESMLALLADDIAHDINQGARETGREAFRVFLGQMNRCYREQISELVIMQHESGARFAAEFVVLGEYLQADAGFPAAHGQRYRLPAGAFFDVAHGKITRVSNYYNVRDWIAQVEG